MAVFFFAFIPTPQVLYGGEDVHLKLKILTGTFSLAVQNHAHSQHQQRRNHKEAGNHQRGDSGHQPRGIVLRQHRNEQEHGHQGQDRRNAGEKGHRLIILYQRADGLKDLETIGEGIQLGFAAGGAVPIAHGDGGQAQILIQRMNGHLRLDLKALGEDWEALDEGPAKGAVACHDVRHIAPEETVYELTYQHIACIVEGALILREIGGGQPVANDHIHSLLQHLVHHLPGILRRVGIVAVDHQVAVRLNVPEHGPDHVALALAVLVADDGPRPPGDLVGAVLGVVIVYINVCLRQRRAIIGDNLGNGLTFIIAGNQNCNLFHRLPPNPRPGPDVV